jgi:nucleoside-diphosphate-sugar epimerase
MKYTLNGSTGWLGHATLGAIQQISPTISCNEFQLLSSGRRRMQTLEFGVVNSYSLSKDLDLLETSDVFVQLAFKTRDYIGGLGEQDYEKLNYQIIHESVQAIKRTKPSHIVMVSSGVVTQWLTDSQSRKFDSYIKMKLIEEEEIRRTSEEIGANLVNLRLWGATGIHMTEPLKYAIGDLIYQNLTAESLKIESNHPVYRRYADASQQMEICLRHSLGGGQSTLDSGGRILEIGDLAEKIISTLGSGKKVTRSNFQSKEPDRYYSMSQTMEELAQDFDIKLINIEGQIHLTSQAVLRHLAQENGI